LLLTKVADLDGRNAHQRRGGDLWQSRRNYLPLAGEAIAFGGTLLPLPACGERVGVRGPFHESELVERPPHPGRAKRRDPTSPRKRGEVKGRRFKCNCSAFVGKGRGTVTA